MIPFKLCEGGDCPLRHTCVRHLEYVRKEAAGNNEFVQVLPEPQYRPELGTCQYEMAKPVATTSGDVVSVPMPDPEPLTSQE